MKKNEINIESMTSDEWIAYRNQKLDDFYNMGYKLKPNPNCSTCDIHNDYVCFEHELLQLDQINN